MGSFQGHALPGFFFIAFAVYWTFQFYRQLFKSMRKGAPPFRSSVTFKCDFCINHRACGRCTRRFGHDIDWEGVVKVVFTGIGFLGEVITAIHGGRFTHLGNGQHATMYFFFGLSGVVDILVGRGSVLLPRGSEYFFGILAFCVEVLLFNFHLHGRTSMDVLVHMLLVYVLYITIGVCLLEAWFRNSPIFMFARIFLVFIQGTWFWQVGFILYLPLPGSVPWDEEDHGQMMVITMMFIWHIAVVLTIMLAIGAGVHLLCFRNLRPTVNLKWGDEEADRLHLLTVEKNNQQQTTAVLEYRDEDSDDLA